VVSFLLVSPSKPCMHISSFPYVLHAPPISLFSIPNVTAYLQY
jgi:hypothetical protein